MFLKILSTGCKILLKCKTNFNIFERVLLIMFQFQSKRFFFKQCSTVRFPERFLQDYEADLFVKSLCTTVACLPPIRGLEKCRVIGHNPHFSSLCSLSCLNPKVLPKGILFSACDWWKAVNCGTSHIDSSEAVVYGIPLGLLGYAS